MLPHALRLLLRLRIGAFFRKLKRDLRNPRKAGYAIFVYSAIVVYLAIFILFHLINDDDGVLGAIRESLPVVLAGFYGLFVLSACFRFPLAYSPAEIQHLFPAPISRRAILTYKLAIQSAAMALGATIFAFFLVGTRTGWFKAWLGLSLFGLFATYSGIVVAMLVRTRTGRIVAAAASLILAGFAAAILQPVLDGLSSSLDNMGMLGVTEALDQSPLYRMVMLPFAPFARVALGAADFSDWWISLVACVAFTGLSLGATYLTDRNFQEATLEASRKRHEQLERIKHGKWGRGAWSNASRIRLPAFPRLGGAGPTLHRQLLGFIRARAVMLALGGVLILGIATGLWAIYGMGLNRQALGAANAAALGAGAYFTILVSMWLRLDFRADYENLDYLKTLPIRPICLAIGQVSAPSLAAFTFQVTPALGFALGSGVLSPYWPFALLLVPANIVWFAIDNAFYLRSPSPMTTGPTPDPSLIGRHMITGGAQVLFVGAVAGLTAGAAWLSWMATGSLAVAWIAAWLVAIPCVAAVVRLTAIAFRDLDISGDKA